MQPLLLLNSICMCLLQIPGWVKPGGRLNLKAISLYSDQCQDKSIKLKLQALLAACSGKLRSLQALATDSAGVLCAAAASRACTCAAAEGRPCSRRHCAAVPRPSVSTSAAGPLILRRLAKHRHRLRLPDLADLSSVVELDMRPAVRVCAATRSATICTHEVKRNWDLGTAVTQLHVRTSLLCWAVRAVHPGVRKVSRVGEAWVPHMVRQRQRHKVEERRAVASAKEQGFTLEVRPYDAA